MSSASRREVVQAGAGVAAVAPFLNVAQANAARTMEAKVIICGLASYPNMDLRLCQLWPCRTSPRSSLSSTTAAAIVPIWSVLISMLHHVVHSLLRTTNESILTTSVWFSFTQYFEPRKIASQPHQYGSCRNSRFCAIGRRRTMSLICYHDDMIPSAKWGLHNLRNFLALA